jgi:hypothetical protein
MIKETFDLTNHTDGFKYEMEVNKFIDDYFQIFSIKENGKIVGFQAIDNSAEYPAPKHFNTLNQLKCFIYNSFEQSEGLFKKSNLH